MGKMSELHAEKHWTNNDTDFLEYELYVAKQAIEELKSFIPNYTAAERSFSADSISYLKSIGCAVTNLKGTRYA